MSRKPKSEERQAKRQVIQERLSARFALALEASGMNGVELAAKARVDASSVSCWLNGKSWPSIELIEDVASALGVTPAWFWTNDPVPIWEPPIPRPDLSSGGDQ